MESAHVSRGYDTSMKLPARLHALEVQSVHGTTVSGDDCGLQTAK